MMTDAMHGTSSSRAKRYSFAAVLTTIALVTTACAGNSSPPSTGDPVEPGDGSLAALIEAAQAEGSLVYYTSQSETDVGPALAFEEKYGIQVTALRLPTQDIATRFMAEVDAGVTTADIVLHSDPAFLDEMVEAGSLIPVVDAGIPDLDESLVVDGKYALVQTRPWVFAWNTDLVAPNEEPQTWEDLLDPKWRGKILHVDIRIANTYVDMYEMLEKEYGVEFFEALADQDVIPFESGNPMAEALAAGEGAIGMIAATAIVQGLMDRGAPIDYRIPDFTMGNEGYATVTSVGANPNAARLFLHWMASEEGNQVFAEATASPNVHSDSAKRIQRPDRTWEPGYADRVMAIINGNG